MSQRRIATWGMCLVVLMLVATAARAELQTMPGERWHSAPDSKGLSRVHSGALVDHLELDVGLWGNYERNPVVLRDTGEGTVGPFDDQSNPLVRYSPSRRRVTALVASRFASELTLSLGLFNWVQLFASVPVVVYQERGEGISAAPVRLERLEHVNLGDIRLGGKIRLLRAEHQLVDLALVPQLTLPVGAGFSLLNLGSTHDGRPVLQPDPGFSGFGRGYISDGMPTLLPELAVSRELFGVFLGGNVGLRLRRPFDIANVTVGPELVGRAGVGFRGKQLKKHVPWMKYAPIEVGLEASGATTVNAPYVTVPYLTPGAPTDRLDVRLPRLLQPYQHSGEVTGTVGVDVAWLHPYVGFSVGVLPGYGTPDYRVISGIRLATDFDDVLQTAPADRDGDGIPDADDACPAVPGVREHRGCPPPALPPASWVDATDTDGDGIPDFNDKCVKEPEDKDGYADEDGCPEPDNDEDGLLDAVDLCPMEAETVNEIDDEDRCPNRAEDADGFEDGDGCPEADNDRDGVMDGDDRCGLEAEVVNSLSDEDGCPDIGKSKVVLNTRQIVILEKVYFETGKDVIQKRSHKLLQQVAHTMKANPELRIRVEGHTDEVGGAEYNLTLSRARAASVRRFLIGAGIEESRLEAEGYGEARPIADNRTEKGREVNRRVEFIVLGGVP